MCVLFLIISKPGSEWKKVTRKNFLPPFCTKLLHIKQSTNYFTIFITFNYLKIWWLYIFSVSIGRCSIAIWIQVLIFYSAMLMVIIAHFHFGPKFYFDFYWPKQMYFTHCKYILSTYEKEWPVIKHFVTFPVSVSNLSSQVAIMHRCSNDFENKI